MSRPAVEPEALAAVVGRYSQLGAFRGLVANGLSANTAACLFETERGVFFAKRKFHSPLPGGGEGWCALAHRGEGAHPAHCWNSPRLRGHKNAFAGPPGPLTHLTRPEGASGSLSPSPWEPRARERGEWLPPEHTLIQRLVERGFPTPRLHANDASETLTYHGDACYAVFDRARGDDRYADKPVFAPYDSPEEPTVAGAMLARFHDATDGLALSPRGLAGLTARYRLVDAPDADALLGRLVAEAPALAGWLAEHPEIVALLPWLEQERRAIAPALVTPPGVIHGDFIKRNLFWEGTAIADVVDFDLWNVERRVFDLALALVPTGFDWPAVLAGAEPDRAAMRAFLAGYEAVRPLPPSERAVLPRVVATCRFEFYLSAIAHALARHDRDDAERFSRLLTDTLGYFAERCP